MILQYPGHRVFTIPGDDWGVKFQYRWDAGVVVASWYLSGGIAAVNCPVARQPKGAASLAASYANLPTPGTYDAAPGVAPTWASATGWTFNGTTQYLLSSFDMSTKPISIIVRLATNGVLGQRTVKGSSSAGGKGFSLDLNATTNVMRFLQQDVALIGTSSSGFADGADTVIAVTYSATGAYAFYINGAPAGSGTSNKTAASGTEEISGQDGGYSLFKGNFLAGAIYNIALSSVQVAAVSTAVAAL